MKHFVLNQQDINDLLGLITSAGLHITANSAARVHQLQAMLSSEPAECAECIELRTKVAALEVELANREATP